MIPDNTDLIKIENMEQFDANDLEVLLHKILNYLKQVANCDAGSIYLKEGEYLKFYIFQNDSFSYETIYRLQEPLKNLKFLIEPNTQTIAVESFITKKIISVDDIYDDTVFNFSSSKEFDKKFNYKTKSILTAPLINYHNGDVIGVLQLINKKEDHKLIPFSEKDKEFLSLNSYLIALSILQTQQSLLALEQVNLHIEEQVYTKTQILENMHQQLLDQVNKDPLTDLFNRKYLQEVEQTIFITNKQNHIDISVIILDIDDFKAINDTFGHFCGDKVITKLASILKSSIRSSDISIRFGGEEFIVILPNSPLANGIRIAEKIRHLCEEFSMVSEKNETLKFTISLGVSMVQEGEESFENALKRADKLLYIAKQSGKNNVQF